MRPVTQRLGVSSVERAQSGGIGQARRLQQLGGSRSHVISPSILVIVIVLSVVFICSGVLHILARCLGRRRARAPLRGDFASPNSRANSIRGQLQHLFSLHDSGVEQVFIDALPVFMYGSIRGLKDSADCAVCLTEFGNEDRLRLLPKCKHAFHVDCIDTWLLSNSTCPLCRRSLVLDADGSQLSTTLVPNPDQNLHLCSADGTQISTSQSQRHGSSFRASLRGSFRFLTDAILLAPPPPPSREICSAREEGNAAIMPPMTPGPTVCVTKPDGSEKVMRVELGKVNTDSSRRMISREVGSASDVRRPRCYSMGSYEYVVDFATLGLPVQTSPGLGSKPTHRTTLSDGVPELTSASHTPGQEDMFWARRGLETPQNLSNVREMMTPISPGWKLESSHIAQQSGFSLKLRDDHEVEDDDDDQNIQGDDSPTTRRGDGCDRDELGPGGLAPSLSLRLFSVEDKIEACGNDVQEIGSGEVRKDKAWEVSVDVTVGSMSEAGSGRSASSSRKSSPLNWLRGRGRRLVYSAASPSLQSPESKVTLQEEQAHVTPDAADHP